MWNKICFKGFVIDEDLYHLVEKYGDKNEKDITKRAEDAIENSKSVIPELYNEDREFPPFLYYIVLSRLVRGDKRKRWIDMTKEEKEEAVKETYDWLVELKNEIRTPTEEELRELGDKVSIKIN